MIDRQDIAGNPECSRRPATIIGIGTASVRHLIDHFISHHRSPGATS
ncbi:hypothetical protein [Bosea vaviloviae]|nr:hypothetical protein [Bosea vaviloviae]